MKIKLEIILDEEDYDAVGNVKNIHSDTAQPIYNALFKTAQIIQEIKPQNCVIYITVPFKALNINSKR